MMELILFVLCYILVFIIYQLFIIRPAKKRRNNKDYSREVFEIKYLENVYKIDLEKVNYNQLLQICCIVSTFDISLIVSLVSLINSLLLEILFVFFATFILIFISYHIVYLFYKKKGMIRK